MPERDWRFRIVDISDRVDAIRTYVEGQTLESFQTDRMRGDAVLRQLEIIGEAAANIPAEVVRRFPATPWAELRGMRNRLIHGYFAVDLAIVWATATRDIAVLRVAMDRMMAELKKTDPIEDR